MTVFAFLELIIAMFIKFTVYICIPYYSNPTGENLFHKNKKTSTYRFMCKAVYNYRKLKTKLLIIGE